MFRVALLATFRAYVMPCPAMPSVHASTSTTDAGSYIFPFALALAYGFALEVAALDMTSFVGLPAGHRGVAWHLAHLHIWVPAWHHHHWHRTLAVPLHRVECAVMVIQGGVRVLD